MQIGAVILVGGKSRRMGVDKAVLSFEGRSFLERIAQELRDFDELILSAGGEEHYKECGLSIVKDIYPDCGPIGGLHAALCACKSDALFCVSCDVPLFRQSLAEYICSKAQEDFDAVVPVSKNGHLHPLCAVYKKSAADVFEKMIISNNYKIIDAYELMRVCFVHLEDAGCAEELLFNVNTPEEFAHLKNDFGTKRSGICNFTPD